MSIIINSDYIKSKLKELKENYNKILQISETIEIQRIEIKGQIKLLEEQLKEVSPKIQEEIKENK